MKRFFAVVTVLFCMGVLQGGVPVAWATDGLEPVAESTAYQEFLKKPGNDLAKMVCLLNYFRTTPVFVRFEGIDYTAQAAYPVGLIYLMTNYRGEKPPDWARKHCYRSIFSNSVILLKFQDGSFRPFRDVVLEKYDELEEALRARNAKPEGERTLS